MQQIAGERARWLAAVLIVAAIGATSVAVQWWPAAAPPAARGPALLLRARALLLVEPPGVLASTGVSQVRAPRPRPLIAAAAPAPHIFEPVAAVADGPPAIALRPAETAAVPATPVTLLASRPVILSNEVPVAEIETLSSGADGSLSPLTFVEMPAVAVGRAVAVAGRGIRTGLRATGAAFKAAF